MDIFLTKKEDFYSIYDVDKNGKIVSEKMKSIKVIYDQVETELKEKYQELYKEFDYFGLGPEVKYGQNGNDDFPVCRWIAVFYVTGGSEGWYIHVEAINHDSRKLLFLGKIFSGRDVAANIVKVISEIMHV